MAEVRTDVAVVGAGPAGLAAAVEAAAAGCDVVVVDRYRTPGGQYHRRPEAAGVAAPPLPPVLARLAAEPRLTVLAGTTVWACETDGDGALLHLSADRRPDEAAGAAPPDRVRARAVVVASGALDRSLPFPGWDLPGVVTAGGAQALLKGQGIAVGRRVVVGGSGPFLLPVAAGLAATGATVVEVVEATAARALLRHAGLAWRHRAVLVEGAGHLRELVVRGVPLRTRHAVVRAAGDGRVEEITVARLAADWTPLPGSARSVAADAVAVSFGFVPQVDLALALGCQVVPEAGSGDPVVVVDARQATTRPGVFAAGEVTGVGGAVLAAAEGGVAGVAAARALGRIDAREAARRARPHRRARDRQRAFTALLGRRFAVRPGWTAWVEAETIVCRCEEVDVATVRAALDGGGASDLRSVKLTTRCGMGRCQARVCGPAVAALVAEATGAPPADPAGLSSRPLLGPVTLGHLAGLDEPGGSD